MTDHRGVSIVRWPEPGPLAGGGPETLLAAYHLRTQAEKGEGVAGVDDLPERYRAEVLDPRAAFLDDVVLLALSGDTAVGCLVLTAPVDGRAELKRLWTDPDHRGLGVASGLVGAALAHAEQGGVGVVRLSVWKWRADAIALYGRLGFTVSESWDEREQLVCMERVM
ncbi:GNAT family N-acetyltransferase [Streptomyces sp. SLBN-31]|jgi:ribosomal protein S18 acetylase RimI-like enzyme|uniref:GNAT family N-acetyltransferase n=1 Tax=Streptomyces sp. SLBN-31 TaxID=2768444 RepID=UPI00114F52A6|nr:GNAT family N-acetyltransferase [Streptomyces sp. SLBN-31]TQJ85649.1 putative acetyltransferase [Streptomyces sp. SLBN-31]